MVAINKVTLIINLSMSSNDTFLSPELLILIVAINRAPLMISCIISNDISSSLFFSPRGIIDPRGIMSPSNRFIVKLVHSRAIEFLLEEFFYINC